MTNEKYASTSYNFLGRFDEMYIALKMGQLPGSGMGKHRLSTPGKWHSKHTIHVASLKSWIHGR
jgi:hypothetical protein